MALSTISNGDSSATARATINTAITAVDTKEATQTAASQAEAEAGSQTAIRSFSPLRVKQAIDALGGSLLTGNTVWIDSVNGNNTTGTRGRMDLPFLTVASALAASSSGDTIELRGGTYAVTATVIKNGVDLLLSPKASLSRTINVNSTLQGVIDDLGSAMTAKVVGGGTISLISNASSPDLSSDTGTVMVAHVSSDVTVHCDKILIEDTGAGEHKAAIWQLDGKLWVEAKLISYTYNTDGSAFGVWWENGELYLACEKLIGQTYGIWIGVNNTPTGDMYARCGLIEATGEGGNNGWPFYNTGSNANARCWIDCFVLKSSGGHAAINNQGANKVYIHAQKIYGDAFSANAAAIGGYLEVRAAKIEAVANQILTDTRALFLYVDEGRVLWNVQDHDAKNFGGWGFHFDGGVTTIRGAEWTASTGVADKQRIICTQPASNGTGFDLPGPYTVRFDIDSGGATGDLVVAINSSDDGNAVAAALIAAWTNPDWTVATGGVTSSVDFTASSVGSKTIFSDAGAGFTFARLINGFTHSGVKVESGDVEFIDCTFDLTLGTEAVFVINGGNVRLRNCRIRGASTDIELNGGTCQIEGGSGTGVGGNFVLVENTGTVEFLSPN